MYSGARAVYAVLAWLFFVGVVCQVFLAGMGLLGDGDMEAHIGFGWTLPLLTIPLLISGRGRAPGSADIPPHGLASGDHLLPDTLPGLRTDAPALAALHPVNALVIFWVSLTIARRATALARESAAAEELPAAQEA